MRVLLLMLLISFTCTRAMAQDGEDEPLAARVLALDTNVDIAKRFCEAIGSMAKGYTLAFVDNEVRYTVRYVYKNTKGESLRIDYRFSTETDSATNKKRTVVNYQKISGELGIMTTIYNFLFSASLTPERVMTYSTEGSPVSFRDKTYEYTFMPDDYEPGYWVLTFH
ncbi:MAG TPA: hypothetical protein VGD89_16005 [Flavipsychrobacter sp.]